MGNPGLLQELPKIAALLSEACGDGAHSAAADRTLAELDTKADFSLNHRLQQCTLGGVVGGLDSLDLQEWPKGYPPAEDLLASVHLADRQISCKTVIRQPMEGSSQALEADQFV
jgi:hypothetical protein